MNASENVSMYADDYDFCNLDPEFPDGSVILVLHYVLFCFGLLGNSMVLWVLLQHIKVKSMTDVCLLNLALSDLLLAVSLPFWAYGSKNLPSCKLITGIYQLGFYSGTLFVTLMSLDRYLAIVHAVTAMRTRTLRYGITASVIIWGVSVVMATPPVIFASLEGDEEDSGLQCQPKYPPGSEEVWKMQKNFSENTTGLFLCLPVMIFCYMKILVVLSRARNSKKNKAMKLIFAIVCVFVVCWVPYNVLVLIQTLQLFDIMNTCTASAPINTAMSFAEIIALSHCCINPVIYAFVGEKFRKSLSGVMGRYLCFRYQSTSTVRETTEGETSNTPVRSDY
ncbi:C-C chemokine receptor type 2 [Salarias fasciatus]|uniref:C-C chemokine receptor type 2-like n=1 Tax=Salarias fasciatus TaxID=181472 RepID=A0A672G4R7_SALFA|nr:C-C chemokine receptor type 2-like [Salarias fasciatus]